MSSPQKENKAALKQGYVNAAITAATLASFLATITEQVSTHHGESEFYNEQEKHTRESLS